MAALVVSMCTIEPSPFKARHASVNQPGIDQLMADLEEGRVPGHICASVLSACMRSADAHPCIETWCSASVACSSGDVARCKAVCS